MTSIRTRAGVTHLAVKPHLGIMLASKPCVADRPISRRIMVENPVQRLGTQA